MLQCVRTLPGRAIEKAGPRIRWGTNASRLRKVYGMSLASPVQPGNPDPCAPVLRALELHGCAPREKTPRKAGIVRTWRAPCPIGHSAYHKDPLTISETDTGRVLVGCFGCQWDGQPKPEKWAALLRILEAIGLGPSALGCSEPDEIRDLVRTVTAVWYSVVSAYPWPARRRVSILRCARSVAILARQQRDTESIHAAGHVVARLAGRGQRAARRSLMALEAAGLLAMTQQAVRVARHDTGELLWEGRHWRLCVTSGLEACASKDSRMIDCSPDVTLYPDAFGWELRPGGPADRALRRTSGDIGAVHSGQRTETVLALAQFGYRGATFAEAAAVAGCSPRTVRRHVFGAGQTVGLIGMELVHRVISGKRNQPARYAVDVGKVRDWLATLPQK